MTRYATTQQAIRDLETAPTTDAAVLAWALARIVDRRIWEVRVAQWGVCLYPKGKPPISEGIGQ